MSREPTGILWWESISHGLSPLIHALLGWLLAWAILRRSGDRRLAVIAGVAPDLDGGFVLFSQSLFLSTHHTFGHSYVFGLAVAIVAGALGRERWKTGLAALGAFSLHLAADIVGTDWPISPLYPFGGPSLSMRGIVPAWAIYGVIDPVAAILAIAAVLVIMYYREVSPFEFFSERLDRWFVSRWTYPLKRRCERCGRRALAACAVCGRAMCGDHLQKFLRARCVDCAAVPKT